jgi:hypothetical protein
MTLGFRITRRRTSGTQASGKTLADWRLLSSAGLAAVVMFLLTSAVSPAYATSVAPVPSTASAPASDGGHLSVTLDAASGRHASATAPLSPGACAAMKRGMAQNDPPPLDDVLL